MLEVFYVKMSNLCSYSSRIFYKCFLRKCNKKRKTGGGFMVQIIVFWFILQIMYSEL